MHVVYFSQVYSFDNIGDLFTCPEQYLLRHYSTCFPFSPVLQSNLHEKGTRISSLAHLPSLHLAHQARIVSVE